jgi:ribosomal protein L24E
MLNGARKTEDGMTVRIPPMKCVNRWIRRDAGWLALAWLAIGVGCGGPSSLPRVSESTEAAADAPSSVPSSALAPSAQLNQPESAAPTGPTATTRRRPVQLGAGGPAAPTEQNAEQQAADVLETMQPLQVLLGRWNGTSRKAQVDQPEWIWDFRSDRAQPALLMKSEKGSYIREGRLTYLPAERRFQFTWIAPDGTQRVLKGDFVQPVQDVPGDDKKLQRTFKLQLTEEQPGAEQWQLAFHQQENNRYILEIDRRRGGGPFQRVDTVHTQREGTSFAISETDYGEKTCIISQGLGTSTVTYKGQTFWVCCSGCKAAFEEDPERWIAKWAERQKKMSAPQ